MRDEMVLCFPRTLLDEIGTFEGIRTDISAYVPRILETENTRFVPRAKAEEDPSHKQVIPYVLFKKGDRYLHYVRGKGSGEKRLVSLGSIGIGGHVNHDDESLFLAGVEFFEEALQRELHEELRVEGRFDTRIVALINDDSTPVGQVHLGIVHLFELDAPNVRRREADVMHAGFAPIAELWAQREGFETWSRFVLDPACGFAHLAPCGR